MKTHPLCQQETSVHLPSRIIDVGPSDGTKEPFLYCSNGEPSRYIALSHRWGDQKPLTTTKRTLSQRQNKIAWSELPKSFQDAVTITRRLGIQYLWIDSLCIIQDDRSDWEKESARMATIFRESYLTISATMAKDSTEGFLSHHENRDLQLELRRDDGTSCSVFVRRPLNHKIFNGPLGTLDLTGAVDVDFDDYIVFKRAWCYQERLLATRIVHFLGTEILFECMTFQNCECGNFDEMIGGAKTTFAQHKNCGRECSVDTWKSTVEEYTSKSITFSQDVLPALSGIVKARRNLLLGNYLAGLWEYNFAELLLWEPAESEKSHRYSDYHAPTFSWPSITGGVCYPYGQEEAAKPLMLIQEMKGVPKGSDPDGELLSGYLKVKGYLAQTSLGRMDDKNVRFDTIEDSEKARDEQLYILPVVLYPDIQHICIEMLLLAPAAMSADRFQRIGRYTRYECIGKRDKHIYDWDEDLEGPMQEVTLV